MLTAILYLLFTALFFNISVHNEGLNTTWDNSTASPVTINTWQPSGGSGNWHDGSNWSQGVVPNITHDVEFGLNPGICNIIGDAEAKSIKLLSYGGVINQGVTANVTVSGDFIMDSGHWNGSIGNANMSVLNLAINGGLFEAPQGNLTINGSMVNDASAEFNARTGKVTFAGMGFPVINMFARDTFFNVTFNPPHATNYTVGVDTMFIENTFEILEGFNSGKSICVGGGVIVETGSDYFFAAPKIIMKGNNTVPFIVRKTGSLPNMSFEKEGGKVLWQTTVSECGGNNENMNVVKGTLEFSNAMFIRLNEFRFESGTTVIAPIADLSIDCTWFNAGGTFDHNNGTFIFAYSTFFQYVNQNGINRFNNLVLEANDGQDITLNDTLHADGLVELKDGRYTGWPIQAFGNVDLYDDFDQTTGQLIFAGNNNTEYRIKTTDSKFTNTFFRKKDGSKVDLYLENMSYGAVTEDYHIESGELCIKDGKNDLNINRFLIKGGTLKAPDTLRYSGGFLHTGGQFNANNGYWEFDGTTVTSYVVQTGFRFYDLKINKTGGGTVQLSDTLVVDNNLELERGTIQFFPIDIKRNFSIDAGWDGFANQIELICSGSQNGIGTINDTDASFITFKVEKSPGSIINTCLGAGVTSLPSASIQVNSGELNVKF